MSRDKRVLVFIDTNIFLDFYRFQGDLSILKIIDEHHDRIITTLQVEMEFKKNRQRVIRKAYENLGKTDWLAPKLPAFLASSKQSAGLATGRERIKKQKKEILERELRMLKNPAQSDRVYQTAQRLFKAEGVPSGSKKNRLSIQRRACKRFMRGYPPRKASDTAIGDAVNWESIIACAAEAGAGVVIVSRDGDYGVKHGDESHVNDWLRQEFKDRIGRGKEIALTDKLSHGFRLAGIDVTKGQQQAEEEFLEERGRSAFSEYDPDLLRRFGEVMNENSARIAEDLARLGEPSRIMDAYFARIAENLAPMTRTAGEEEPNDEEPHD